MTGPSYEDLWASIGHCPFERVRESCREVCEASVDITLSPERLRQFAHTLRVEDLADVRHTAEHHLIGEGPATIAYFLVLDSLNFGSGYFPHLSSLDGYSGYYTLAVGLKRWFFQAGVPTPEMLASLSVDDLCVIFGQHSENTHAREMMALYRQALQQLSAFADEHLDGRLETLLTRAEHSTRGLARLLTHMPMFRDVVDVAGRRVFFFKRVQMMAQDLALASKEGDFGGLEGVEKLTAFADNLLPFALKAEGVISYSDTLSNKIARQHLFTAGERQEVELRAFGVHGVELLRQELAESGAQITSCDLDVVVWNHGLELQRQVGDQRHLCRTTFY